MSCQLFPQIRHAAREQKRRGQVSFIVIIIPRLFHYYGICERKTPQYNNTHVETFVGSLNGAQKSSIVSRATRLTKHRFVILTSPRITVRGFLPPSSRKLTSNLQGTRPVGSCVNFIIRTSSASKQDQSMGPFGASIAVGGVLISRAHQSFLEKLMLWCRERRGIQSLWNGNEFHRIVRRTTVKVGSLTCEVMPMR